MQALLVAKSLYVFLGLIAVLALVILFRKYALRRELDLLAMWSDTRMVVYASVTAALYVAALTPFKALPIVPGLTEIRPGVALPIFLSFLFGPAAAWGAAFGNFIGDFFGTLGPGSLFGFFGNLLLGYAPYALYRAWCGHSSPGKSGLPSIFFAAAAIAVGALACATTIAWGADAIGLAPFVVLAPIISINNLLVGLILALPLTLILYPRAEKWGVVYFEIMEAKTVCAAPTGKLGALLFTIGAVGGFAAGFLASYTAPGGLTVGWMVAPGIILMLIGMILL